MRPKAPPLKARRYALCVAAGAYEGVDLIPRKVYEVWPDAEAESRGQLRVVDESGEDYLFPAKYFQLLTLPAGAQQVFRRHSGKTLPAARRAGSKTRR
jgi:hypothetical protein